MHEKTRDHHAMHFRGAVDQARLAGVAVHPLERRVLAVSTVVCRASAACTLAMEISLRAKSPVSSFQAAFMVRRRPISICMAAVPSSNWIDSRSASLTPKPLRSRA